MKPESTGEKRTEKGEAAHAGPWLIVARVVFTLGLVGCILFIFQNSLQVAAVSSGQSTEARHLLNRLLAHVGLGSLSEFVVRKLAHFAEFCLEGFWLMLCLRVYTRRFLRHVSWPMLGGLLTALADETIQLGVAGRSSRVTDVWLDFVGVLAGLTVALMVLLLFRGLSRHCTRTE